MIDDANWPNTDLNELNTVGANPWPNWVEDTVNQPLVGVNLTAEYKQGVIQPVPALADSWNASSDETVYTFNLRQNVQFSTGDPFNAYQVWAQMYGFYYLSANSSAWLMSYNLFDMSSVNFGPATIGLLNQSGLNDPSPQAVKLMANSSWPIYATGPYQIVFHLKAPFVYFPETLVAFEGLMLDTNWILKHGGFGTPTQYNTYFNQHPIPGTGPYIVSQVAEQSYVKFTQNPNYWGRNLTEAQIAANPMLDPGHVKTVIVYAKLDDVARYTDLSTGAAQMVAIRTGDWNLIQSNPDKFSYLMLPAWSPLITAIPINTQTYPTNITDVRQAIVHAINYTDISQKAFFGQTSPWMGPEYPAWKDFYDLGNFTPYQYNLTLAKQYLAKANVTKMPDLTFTIPAGCDWCTTVAVVVQSDLSQIGITVDVNVVQFGAYFSNQGSYSTNLQNAALLPSLTLLGGTTWAPSTLTPADYWVSFVSNQSLGGNQAIYYNPVVQICVNAFTNSTDVGQITPLCKQAQAQIYNDAPYAWLGIMKLWYAGGSLVWEKNVIRSFYVEQLMAGGDTAPLFNTVTFGS